MMKGTINLQTSHSMQNSKHAKRYIFVWYFFQLIFNSFFDWLFFFSFYQNTRIIVPRMLENASQDLLQ